MDSESFDELLNGALSRRRREHRLRQRQVVHPLDATHVEIEGKRYVNFCSNNYLGLTHHPRVMAAAAEATARYGTGSGASALVTGYTEAHASAEKAIAAWKGTESAVLLPSGYQANHAAVQAIAGAAEAEERSVRFLIDKLVHASLIDAVRATGQAMRVFPHGDLTKLQRLLDEAERGQAQIVVTESIFSMDGDAADLRELVRLRAKRHFLLLVDEAHGSGGYGKDGAGYAAECGVGGEVDIFVVTLSKALGSIGGAVCGSKSVCDAVVNFGRAYVYSTAVPPATAAAAETAIGVLRDEPDRQNRVRELAQRVRLELGQIGNSPIIPVMLGDEEKALSVAEKLKEAGMIVLAIRPPTVPAGTSRLRVTVSCEHSDDEVEKLIRGLQEAQEKGRDKARPFE